MTKLTIPELKFLQFEDRLGSEFDGEDVKEQWDGVRKDIKELLLKHEYALFSKKKFTHAELCTIGDLYHRKQYKNQRLIPVGVSVVVRLFTPTKKGATAIMESECTGDPVEMPVAKEEIHKSHRATLRQAGEPIACIEVMKEYGVVEAVLP